MERQQARQGWSVHLDGSWVSNLTGGMDINLLSFLAHAPTQGILQLPGWLCALPSPVALLSFSNQICFGDLQGRHWGSSSLLQSALISHLELGSVFGSLVILIIALFSYGYITNYHKFSCLKQKWIPLG